MAALVYDTGALRAAVDGERQIWALHRRALERGIIPMVPTTVLVEAWGGDASSNLTRFLTGTQVEELNSDSARVAGELLASAGGPVRAVDATVVELATRKNAVVVTKNSKSIQRLARAAARGVTVLAC